MQRDILYAITEHYNSLTRSGKKLADYIFANKTNVQYMSITSLAENSNVSEATITRFCKELGMSGYNDFKLSLAKANGALTMKISSEEFETTTDDTDFKTICKKLFVVNVTALKETLHLLDESSALQAIQMLSTANRVYCFGQGGSNLMAKEAWARFSTATSKFSHRRFPYASSGFFPLQFFGRDFVFLLLRLYKGYERYSHSGQKGRCENYFNHPFFQISCL